MNSNQFNVFLQGEPRQEEGVPLRILVIEDEPDVARLLKRVIESCGAHEVRLETAPLDLAECLRDFAPDLVLTDLMMPGMDGLEVIRQAKALNEDLPVVVVSAYATLENAVETVKAGAFDFLAKPFSPESVELTLAKAARERQLRARAASLCRQMQSRDGDLAALQGESGAMRALRAWICRVREPRTNVLIEGESGTGKELVARAIHAGRGPFVAINMAAVPDELAESELFGHRKGAFTGAARDRIGLLQEAGDGVVFLDEVNAMSPLLQAKLLRVLQEKRMRPVGANQEVALNFRLLAASNRDLESLVNAGQFRRDLYHRLNVLSVRLPPLRERREDIPLLAEHFVQRYARAHGRRLRQLAPEAAAALMAADWPGNVRELENVVEQAVILCPEGRTDLPLSALPARLGGAGWQSEAAPGSPRPATLEEAERHYILSVLRQTGGNKAQAARILDIDYKTLLRKLNAAAASETG
ncbi:MAG: sigma-54-dependent transcriptional regulator [Sulfuricellaceae bacterium]|jgi:DNA-binding NtrC family response regulator